MTVSALPVCSWCGQEHTGGPESCESASITAMRSAVALGDFPAHHVTAVQAGAKCWECPLLNSGRGPVPPSLPEGEIDILVIAEAPGHNEVSQGAVLIGASGREIRSALAQAGANMGKVGLTNTLLCQPEGDLKKYLQAQKRQGKASPIDCCRPRLQRELARSKFAILMGSASLQGVGINQPILKLRGTPVRVPNGPPAVPVPHAAFVLRDEGRTMRPIFRADVTKAVRISRGGNTWKDPPYFVARTAAEVENFLVAQGDQALSVDVETDGKDQWMCNLRRIGIGTRNGVMIYSPLSVRGQWMLSTHEIQAQSRAIAAYFQRAQRVNLHNGISFDSVVLWRHGMPLCDESILDTMVAHQIGITSELPHRLDFLGSIYTDVPFWKDDVKHSEVKDDAILDKYLSFDIAVTDSAAPYVEHNLRFTGQEHIYKIDAELFRIGRSMATLGVWIDPELRWKFAAEYQKKSNHLRDEFVKVAGRDINPASYPQVRKLLYNDLGLPLLDEHMTDSGDPSTDENTLLDLLSMGVNERTQKVIHGLIGYREAEKILGTNTGHIENGELVGGPPVHADGRLRTNWRPGKTSGRWGSSDPVNMQNIPKKLRAMFKPALGNVYVAADMSAVELRLIAFLSGDQPLIDAFKAFDEKRGPDVHIFNACTVFRCKPEVVNDEVRRFIKCVAAGSRIAVPGVGQVRVEDMAVLPPSVLTEQGPQVASEFHDVGEVECLTVHTSRGLAITVAERHRLKLDDGSWRWADELATGDTLQITETSACFPSQYARVHVNPWVTKPKTRAAAVMLPQDLPGLPEVAINDNMGYLLGTILGDGGFCPTGSYVVGMLSDGVIHEVKLCAEALGLPLYYQKKYEKNGDEFGRLNIHSANWRRFLVRLGLHDGVAKVLRVPEVIFRSPKSVVLAFLAGMFDTDGTVGELNVCSKSMEFIHDIALLLNMLGLHGAYEESWNKTYQKMYYRLRLRRHAIIQLLALGGMRAKGKLARQRAKMEKWGSRASEPSIVAKVLRVERVGKRRVYDLTVPSTHSYVANGLVNHNSFVYALSYDAQPPKIYQTLSLLRDDELKPLFPHITLQEIERVYNLWWQLHPAVPAWKKKLMHSWRSRGFIETAVHKRKRFFIGGESATEMDNFPVQGAAADLQNDAIKALVQMYPYDFANHRGLIINGHDQLVVECGAHEAEQVKKIVEHCMQKRMGDVLFPAVAKADKDWKAVS